MGEDFGPTNFFMYFLHFSSNWGCLPEMVTGEEFERERESKRDRERYVKSGFLGWKKPIWDRARERKRGRERERDTSNQAFWGGKTPILDREEGRERKRDTERYIKSSFLGWKDTNLGQGRRETERDVKSSFLGRKNANLGRKGREREREKERHREIRQIKLFGVERHQFGTERRERNRKRHREQIKLFGVERQQFGTERKGERERDTERYVKSSFLGWKEANLGQ